MLPDPNVLAEALLDTLDRALAPLLARQAVLEAAVTALREAQPAPGLGKALEGLDRSVAGILADVGGLRERVAAVEVRALQPGPAGPPGQDGIDGKDGEAGLRYRGVFAAGATYARGDLVTWDGSAWHCQQDTTTHRPGESAAAWQLMVKHGRDGKDVR